MAEIRPMLDLIAMLEAYDTDIECRTYLEELRWPKGVCCLRCGSASISRITTRKQYDCNACRYRFSVTTGTISSVDTQNRQLIDTSKPAIN
jgi:transposase-like protein